MPPSPWLSARITKTRYLNEITKTSDQTISEITPRTFGSVTSIPPPARNDSRIA